MEQVEQEKRLSEMSFLSINGPFNNFFKSKYHEDYAKPSNYNQINVGNQEIYQGVNGNKNQGQEIGVLCI